MNDSHVVDWGGKPQAMCYSFLYVVFLGRLIKMVKQNLSADISNIILHISNTGSFDSILGVTVDINVGKTMKVNTLMSGARILIVLDDLPLGPCHHMSFYFN